MTSRRDILAAVLCGGLLAPACQRERREFRPDVPFAESVPFAAKYQGNAYALSEGKRLFAAFNCNGCHGNGGGGGMGAVLSDDRWTYGPAPSEVFASISRGRPDGMPAYGRKAPAYQLWQLTAYVRSLGGLESKTAAPGRNDDIQAGTPENSRDPQPPRHTPEAKWGDRP